MEHVYFDIKEKRKIGVYYPSQSFSRNELGIIICNPLGHEYICSYYALLKLAKALSHSGFHVFRFDYYGTGDSFGVPSEICLKSLLDDLDCAVREIKEGINLKKIILVGLRFGSLLAYEYSLTTLVDGVVLWSPIFDGKNYLDELKRLNTIYFQNYQQNRSERAYTKDVFFESLGFQISDRLYNDLSELNHLNSPICSDLLIFSEKFDQKVMTFERLQRPTTNKILVQFCEQTDFWYRSENEFNQPLVPIKDIEKIVTNIFSFF
jgi:uncharacterized protein